MLQIRLPRIDMCLIKYRLKNYSKLILLLFIILCILSKEVNNLQTIERVSNIDVIAGDVFFEIIHPSELEYTYRIKPARDFGAPFNSSFWLKKIKLVPSNPIEGCTIPLNSKDINGNVAFVERGECSFLQKTLIAENAGAKAIIITEGSATSLSDLSSDDYIEMIADKTDNEVNIPAGFLLGRSGSFILNTLNKLNAAYAIINIPVNMTYVPIHKMNQPPWVSW